ncbi:Rhomboid family protein [Metarhizium album ARSEF 1941]|uniref:Rhomboid-type serine protease n=1 Tax=Metarhizium album (strain ARSEF 1941) TaxID=1081103 RepID=A0A0B2WQ67_METAS|nr:Rhomboid family protein [Metarhizium album ARSEF 1941]KHN95744.1 Rhomboid family protein [Metarhizium album ARSEF 1941]
MTSNNYYYDNSQRPPPSYHSTPDPYAQQAHMPYHGDQSFSAAPNPYRVDGSSGQLHGQQTGQSPFVSVFDDNYAVGSTNNLQQGHQGQYPDTAYYGQAGVAGASHARGDIPLQNRAGKNDDVNDHIYDASDAATSGGGRKKKKIRVGELGMFGSDKNRIPWVCYVFTVVQVAVFIGEIIKNGLLTGSPIMIKPQFNPMIGPSTQVLINMGARYVPCMHNVKEIQGSNIPVLFLCPNATKSDEFCPLSEVCGFGGVPNPTFNNADQSPQPNQWFRFIVPIFLHAGLIHIGFNMLLQMTLAKEMEQAIGSIRFVLVYVSAGIFGFVMGGNFAAPGIASTGASGSLFGVIALTLLDLLYSWSERRNPVKDLMFIILDIVISFVLGLLPGLDNFSHIGGFLMGLGLGVCLLHSPNSLRRKIGGSDNTSYSVVNADGDGTGPGFLKSPIGFFKGRKPLWWAWWLVRAGFLIAVIVVFIVLLNNFYNGSHTCSWCKYLSCLVSLHLHPSPPRLNDVSLSLATQPVSNWCDIGTIQKTTP